VNPSSLILIVDDSEPLRSAMRELICAAISGCICIGASTGESGVAVVKERRPALVVMDLKLPGMNGIEATRQIKALFPDTQVVMVSLYETAHFQTEAARAGATAFLPKRLMHRELIPMLISLLEGNGGEHPLPVANTQTGGVNA
jgi:DNA-binding NarL/FixJ family response regulator